MPATRRSTRRGRGRARRVPAPISSRPRREERQATGSRTPSRSPPSPYPNPEENDSPQESQAGSAATPTGDDDNNDEDEDEFELILDPSTTEYRPKFAFLLNVMHDGKLVNSTRYKRVPSGEQFMDLMQLEHLTTRLSTAQRGKDMHFMKREVHLQSFYKTTGEPIPEDSGRQPIYTAGSFELLARCAEKCHTEVIAIKIVSSYSSSAQSAHRVRHRRPESPEPAYQPQEMDPDHVRLVRSFMTNFQCHDPNCTNYRGACLKVNSQHYPVSRKNVVDWAEFVDSNNESHVELISLLSLVSDLFKEISLAAAEQREQFAAGHTPVGLTSTLQNFPWLHEFRPRHGPKALPVKFNSFF